MKKNDINNLKLENKLVEIVYKKIFQLDTETLTAHYWSVYAELIKREDFNSLDDLKMSYEILKDELRNRGVKNV